MNPYGSIPKNALRRYRRRRKRILRVPPELWKDLIKPGPEEVWCSHDWLVRVYPRGLDATRMVVIREHNPRAGEIPWVSLYKVKHAVLGPDVQAIEIYPTASHLLGCGGCRILFALNSPLPYEEQVQ